MTLDSCALSLGHLFYYWQRAKVWLEYWLQDSNCIADVGGYSIVVSSDSIGLDIELTGGMGRCRYGYRIWFSARVMETQDPPTTAV